MIISASRRTDIPAFYSDWLINRFNAGYCSVKNPFNPEQIRKISLLPQDVDGIVLWTKNSAPLLSKRAILDNYQYYFQHTITPYHADMEVGLASKKDVIIPAFIEFSKHIGAERMIWRYDPIIITERYSIDYHIRAFTKLCKLLTQSTKKCVISFVNTYKSVVKNLQNTKIIEIDLNNKILLSEKLLQIAILYDITLCACCEIPELYQVGIQPISCINANLFAVNGLRDKKQRKGCNCDSSVDIGVYSSCVNGCRYCYANHSMSKAWINYKNHDKNSSILL